MAGLPYSRKDGVVGRRCSGARKNFFSISPFLFSFLCHSPAAAFASFDDSAGWVVFDVCELFPLFRGLFSLSFYHGSGRAESPSNQLLRGDLGRNQWNKLSSIV